MQLAPPNQSEAVSNMNKSLFVTLLFVVAFKSTEGQSDEKTDCSKMDFTDVPKDCCKKPFGAVFSPETLKDTFKECKSSSKSIEWLNSYKINSLQQQDIKNFIDETNKNTIKELCSAGAFAQCVFTKQNWVNESGTIDIDTLSTYIQGVTTEASWKTIVSKTLEPLSQTYATSYLFTDIVENRFEKITCPSGQVNLVPLMMAQMLQSEFIWMCPQQNVYTSKNKCTETMKNYQFCDGKIYSNTAKGVFFFPSV